MLSNRCDFDRRSGEATLPASSGSPSYLSRALFDQQASGDNWRLVHAYSRDGLPFQVRLRWSAGDTSALEAEITVPRAMRACVFARSLQIHGANLAPSANRVWVSVPDGYAETANVFELLGSQNVTEQRVSVPPFATRMRLDLEQDTAYATSYLRIMDALGTTRAHVYANSQPDQGLPLGSAHNVYVMATASWRVTYLLQL